MLDLRLALCLLAVVSILRKFAIENGPHITGFARTPEGRDGKIMLCNKCRSDEHLARQHDYAKSLNDSIHSGIRRSVQKGVRAIHLLTGIVNSLGDEDQRHEDYDGDPDKPATLNMVPASPGSEDDFGATQEDGDAIHFMGGEAAVGRLPASLASGQPNVNPPNKYLGPGV